MYLFSHEDLHLGNIIIDKNCNILLVDNDSALAPSYRPYGKYNFYLIPRIITKQDYFMHRKLTVQDFKGLSKNKIHSFKFNSIISFNSFL